MKRNNVLLYTFTSGVPEGSCALEMVVAFPGDKNELVDSIWS